MGHPMIQPVSWAEPPDILAASMSSARLALYTVIWDSALACTLKAPTLHHHRAVYRAHGGAIAAFASAQVAATSLGFWRFRQDWPRAPFAQSRGVSVPAGKLTVVAATVMPMPGATLGGLLRNMATHGVSTAASCAGTLKDMLTQEPSSEAALLRVRAFGAKQTPYIELTDQGRRSLAAWEATGLVDSNRRVNELVNAVASQETSYRAALDEIGGQWLGPGAGEYIDAVRARWTGLSRNQMILDKVTSTTQAPKFSGLPVWLDPEQALAEDHPLRSLKLDMEVALAQSRSEWATLTPPDQATARLHWLARYCEQGGDLAESLRPHLQGMGASFSGLRFWMTGSTQSPRGNSRASNPRD